MNLSRYYTKATFYPSIIVILATIIFSIIDNRNYKSEWLTAGSVVFLTVATAFIYCLAISILSLTIFMNKNLRIRNNAILNFLSWFLLPFTCITIVLAHETAFKIRYNEAFDSNFTYVLILNIPFVAGLLWTYYQYRKTIAGKSRDHKNFIN